MATARVAERILRYLRRKKARIMIEHQIMATKDKKILMIIFQAP